MRNIRRTRLWLLLTALLALAPLGSALAAERVSHPPLSKLKKRETWEPAAKVPMLSR